MAPGSALLNFSGLAEDRPSADCYAALFAPLDQLLCAGGDERIALIGKTGLNAYGCKPAPRRDVIAFSSSTASSISERAYVHARDAQLRLVEEAAARGILESFDSHIEQLRGSLRSILGLERTGAEILFSPSGTDSQLQALFLTGMLLGTPLTTIVVGSDQTGSGTAYTAGARHFATRTARGKQVLKGSHVVAEDAFASLEIPFAGTDGAFRTADEMDRLVIDAVAQEIGKGRKVLLQAMHASKFGWRAPSDACLDQIAANWPGSVQVVVDACQMRLSPERIAGFLERGYLVLFTGSKFFCGPPLSGGLLVPSTLSHRLAIADEVPAGLAEYANRCDLPLAWTALRNGLPLDPNFGQWLRWEAALAEMRAYRALPPSYRKDVLAALAYSLPRAFRASGRLEPLAAPPGFVCDATCGDEFSAPTIFPFLLRDETGVLDCDAVADIHRALNRDIGNELSFAATPHECALAAKTCHIGQPVKLKLPNGRSTSALRIAIGSRTLFEAWPAGGSENAATRILADVATVIGKINLILKNRQPLAGRTLEISYGQ